MASVVVMPWHRQLWERVRAAFRTEVRPRTAAEDALAGRAAELQRAVKERDAALARLSAEARTLRTDVAERDATISVREVEVGLLTEVVERGRRRVRAESEVSGGPAAPRTVPQRRA